MENIGSPLDLKLQQAIPHAFSAVPPQILRGRYCNSYVSDKETEVQRG
jgi:hypothetical protein